MTKFSLPRSRNVDSTLLEMFRTHDFIYDCEDKDRFRSRDLQFETISSTIESRLVKVERKNGDYLNGGYPNGCRDRESQDRESESTLARHH